MEKPRYKAFISYSHHDQAWAAWLQRALENYRVPSRLVGTEGEFGPIPRRLLPVFRDREDLSSASDLTAKVQESLENSESLIVVCSPAAVKSGWVNEEARHFADLGRADRILALIVDGDPQATEPDQRCFPPALTQAPDGSPREPMAADARKWADGRLLAKLKLVAGILGIPLDALRRREMQRRQRRWMISMVGVVSIAIIMTVLAITAITARKAAENRRQHAEDLVGYMVGDLKSKLDDAGRLDILEGMGGRVSEYLESLDPGEVTDESLNQQAQVWRQLGEVGMSQGALGEALKAFTTSRDILAELHRRNPDSQQYIFELGNAAFWVGYVHLEKGEFDQAEVELEKYQVYSERLVEADPDNPEWVLENAYAHSNIAALIIRRGNGEVERALQEIQAAVEFDRKAMRLDPDNPLYVSEYSETLAWLADTHLMACNLGEALKARQENTAINRQLLEKDPGNVNRRSRYAWSLTGVASVAAKVGLIDLALENYLESQKLLGQLSIMEPSNLIFRFDYHARDIWIADLFAEQNNLDQALVRMASIREPLLRVLEEESWENLLQHVRWVSYLLIWSDVQWRAKNEQEAGQLLDEAVSQLEQLLLSEQQYKSFEDELLRARFLVWQQRGDDLFSAEAFSHIPVEFDTSESTCNVQANMVGQAILLGEQEIAKKLTSRLLGKGYFEPGFIRMCRQYGLCQEGG